MTESTYNPFPGLRPFSAEEDYLFFGREDQTNELLQLLREHRFIAVVGTSGSGKSSLVRAGLLPALFGGTMVSVGSRWEIGVFRPGGDPILNLAQSLIDCDLYDGDDPETLPRLMATLRRSRNGLVEAIRQSDLGERHNFLLVVDQFEELFRFSADRPEHQELASEFAQLLLHAASSPEIPVYITLTMRSDYLGECAQLPGLAEAVNHGEYLIPRLTRDQRRDAIERPVAVGGGKISRRLINQLLNEVGDDVDQLPVLQHALMRIWDCWEEDRQNDEPIDLRHYEAVGGLTRALSQHADEVFEELGDRHAQLLCERIFKGLTERGSDERGIRRPTPMAALCKIVEGQAEDVRRVLDAFRKVGRTFVMPLEETAIDESTIIDISHESLMRVWGRLRNWVDEESQSARVYRRLAETASLFHDQRAGHYRDPDLSIAWAWREQNSPNRDWADRYAPGFEAAIEFLNESKEAATAEERERELRRQRELEQAQRLAEAQLKARRRSQGLTVCAMVAAIVIGFFWNSASDARREAEKQRDAAERAAEQERVAKEAETKQRGIAERESQQNRLGLYAASIRQAERELSSGVSRNTGLDQLDQWNQVTSVDGTPDTPAMRDWEWYYLKGKAKSLDSDPRIETLKLGSRVNSVGRWSPDGEKLAVTGSGNQVLVIDGQTREIIQMIQRRRVGYCPRIAWSPDGESIAIDDFLGPVEIYDLNTGMLTQILNHNGGNTNSTLSWNHTLNLIAYRLDEGKVGIYDMAQKQLVNVFSTSSEVRDIEWSPDGSQLAFSVTPGGLHILDYPSMEVSYKLSSRHVQRLRWTHDGKQLICQDVRPSQLFVVTPATNSHTPSIESGLVGIWGMAAHPQKPWVALSGPRGEICIFDYRKLALVDSLKGFAGFMVGVDWRPQGDLLFVAGFLQGETMLVDLTKRRNPLIGTGIELSGNQILGNRLLDTKLLPDGNRVALSSDVAGRLQVTDFGNNEVISTIDTPLNDLVYSYDWSPNGELLAVAGNQRLLILNGQNPEEIQASYSLEDIGRLASLEWSNCGRYLAFTQGNNPKPDWGVLEYVGSSLNLLRLDEVDSPPSAIAWHPKHPKLAVGLRQNSRRGGPIQLWDVRTQNLELTIASVDTNVGGLSFSHRGDRLAVIFDRPSGLLGFEASGGIEIFSSVDGDSLVTFPPQSMKLTDVNWSTTDQRLVTASFDGNVRVWRVDGTELLTLNPFNSAPVKSAFWDENGGRLIACAPLNTELYSWTIEEGLDDVTLNGSPVLLGNLLSKGGIDPLKSANLYASSGQYDRAAKIFDQLSEGSPTVNIFSSHYWRLREYPDSLRQIANSDLSGLDPATLKSILDSILTNPEEQSDSPSTSWDYLGRDTSRLNLKDLSQDEFSRLQIIRTRYYATRSAQVALVLGGGENIIAWHNNELTIDHRLPGLVSNGEIGALLNLDQGWNDIIFAVYSDSQQLELEPYLLETPSRILANSLVTWDGLSSGTFERAASELNLSQPVKTTIRYYLEILFGDFDAATSTLEGLAGATHSKFFDHALLLGERGEFEKAAHYARRIYDDFPAPYTEALLGEALAKSNGVSLVNSEAEWDCYSSVGPEGDQDIGNLLRETKVDRHDLWHQKLDSGWLRYWVGNGGFPRTLPNCEGKEAILFQTSFDTEQPLENLLFEIDTPDAFVVYLDGEECYRFNVAGPDRFNKRSDTGRVKSDADFARRSIPLSKSLSPGRHRLAVSVHQDVGLPQIWLRCPTLTGFTDGLPEIPDDASPGVELAFHLSVAATRGHFDHARVDTLLDSGIDRLRIEDLSHTIYTIFESSKTLDDSEQLVLGKILSKAALPARSSNISLAIAPTLRLGDDEKMEELLANWQILTANDSRLLAADLLSKHRLEADGYEKTRADYLTTANRDRLNSHQQLLICALALTPLSEEQHQILEGWKSELSFWQDQSQDNALNGLSSALLALQSNTLNETTKDWLSRLEKAEIQSPVDRYLASAILNRALDPIAQESSRDRRELQSKLDATLQMEMRESEEDPFTLEQWIKYRVAKSLLN